MISIRFKQGFTLIELLVVISIIGILSTIIYTSINPGRQFAQSRNAQRQTDVVAAGNALAQYRVEHSGSLPSVLTTTPQSLTVVSTYIVPTYLATLPADPKTGNYNVSVDAQNRVIVSAPAAELGVTISVTQ